MPEQQKVVVVGAGVIGLTTALLLARSGTYSITLVSKHMPGDYDIEYTSPWAGANCWPMSAPNSRSAAHERASFLALWNLATTNPAAGIHVQNSITYGRNKDAGAVGLGSVDGDLFNSNPWFKELTPEFRVLRKEELPEGIDYGSTFKSFCINTAVYLPWLVGQCLALGVTFKRAVLEHICDAAALHTAGKADLVVNCTGLLARKLGGVMDTTVQPARGQIVLVRNPAPAMVVASGCDGPDGDNFYCMTRAAGGGTILGGTFQIGSWESQPDPNTAQRIMRRAVELVPGLVKPGQGVEGLDVIRHGVGLRPYRAAGPRIETEVIDGLKVVHNYGSGSYGYQTSYGVAEDAVKLVEEALGTSSIRSKL